MATKDVEELINEFSELDSEILAMKEQQLELAEQIVAYFKSKGIKNSWGDDVLQLKKEIHQMKIDQGYIAPDEEE